MASDNYISARRQLHLGIPERAPEALASVESEALRRIGRGDGKEPIREMTLLEPRLWSKHAERCWDLELRVSVRQEREFFLRAPDERDARAAFEAAHPAKAEARQEIVLALGPGPQLFQDLA